MGFERSSDGHEISSPRILLEGAQRIDGDSEGSEGCRNLGLPHGRHSSPPIPAMGSPVLRKSFWASWGLSGPNKALSERGGPLGEASGLAMGRHLCKALLAGIAEGPLAQKE